MPGKFTNEGNNLLWNRPTKREVDELFSDYLTENVNIDVQSKDGESIQSLREAGSRKETRKKQCRTVFVKGFTKETTQDELKNIFASAGIVRHTVVVIDPNSGISKGYGFITFETAEEALQAIESLHETKLNGQRITVEIARPRVRVQNAHESDQVISAGEHGQSKVDTVGIDEIVQQKIEQTNRLIVRNLPWKINTSEKLTRLFQSFGKVTLALVPRNSKGRQLGFGIVMLRGRKNAETALQRMNGQVIQGRTIAVDWAVDRETWNLARECNNADKANNVDELDKSSSDQSEMESNWSSESSSEVEEGSRDESWGGRDREDLSATVFVRNLPFKCTDEDLKEHFSQFGKVRWARVVVDCDTGMSRGSGFVRFGSAEHATTCASESPTGSATSNRDIGTKKCYVNGCMPYKSIIQDYSSDPTGRYTLGNRVLHVSPAIPQDQAEVRRENKRKEIERYKQVDRRNVYLLYEGMVTPTSPFYAKLSQADIQARQASFQLRKKLLKDNPLLFVSLVRLSVRNLPRGLKQVGLKALARKAVVEFATEVKLGKRDNLSKDECNRNREEMRQRILERKRKGHGIVRQAKIEFESREGLSVKECPGGRSRGFGFIEFYTHRHALMALRWLNGRSVNEIVGERKNDGSEGKNRRLLVEFAIENTQIVARRKKRMDGGQDK